MVIDKRTFKGISPSLVPAIIEFFQSAHVCSTIFKSYTTLVKGKDGVLVKKKSWDMALENHRKLGLTAAFAGIASLTLNTEFWTFTLEVDVLQGMEIVEWELTEYAQEQAYRKPEEGKPGFRIGCPKSVLAAIDDLLGLYDEEIK